MILSHSQNGGVNMATLEQLSKTVRVDKCIMLSGNGNIENEVDDMANIEDVYPSDLLSAQDIVEFGGKKIVVIKEAKVEQVGQGANAAEKIVISFVDIKKRLASNKTNANKIAEIAGNKDYTQWQGVTLELYNITTTFRGQEVQAIRVKKPETDAAGQTPAVNSSLKDDILEWGRT